MHHCWTHVAQTQGTRRSLEEVKSDGLAAMGHVPFPLTTMNLCTQKNQATRLLKRVGETTIVASNLATKCCQTFEEMAWRCSIAELIKRGDELPPNTRPLLVLGTTVVARLITRLCLNHKQEEA